MAPPKTSNYRHPAAQYLRHSQDGPAYAQVAWPHVAMDARACLLYLVVLERTGCASEVILKVAVQEAINLPAEPSREQIEGVHTSSGGAGTW